MRVCAVNGTTTAPADALGHDALSRGELERLTGALGCGVGERGESGGAGELVLTDAGHPHELGRATVAVGDRAGLVQQQGGDVARGFDGAARHREDIALHEAIHACDADRREQRADRRRDEADQQRDQHRNAHRSGGVGRDRIQREHDDHEDDRQTRQQDAERDLARCLLAARTLDKGDHPVDERLAGLGGDAHDDAIGEHAGAAGHRAAVAAGLADDRCGLSGDRRLVDGRNAPHDVAVAGDELTGGHQHDVAEREFGRGHRGHGCASRLRHPWWRRSRRSGWPSCSCASCAGSRPGPCRGPRRLIPRCWRTERSARARRRFPT